MTFHPWLQLAGVPRTARHGAALLVALAVLGSACGSNGGGTGDDHARLVPVAQAASSPREQTTSALDDPMASGLPKPLVDPADLISGGPPPDGIPPIDHPRFERAGDVRFLRDQEPVLAIKVGGEARAFPVQIMTWHEIVNDTIAGTPVTMSYCPLCNSAIAYDRRLGGRVLDFGTSGKLYQSALVMYDRQTESLWSHFIGQAVAGALTGETLQSIPVATVAWGDWRRAHPEGLVLSRRTGFDRPYGQNPYPGYDDVNTPPFLFRGKTDGRLAAKERVVGIRNADDAVAILVSDLKRRHVVETTVGGLDVVAWLKPGTVSGLDAGSVASGRDVGATGVFQPLVDDQHLSFEPVMGGFRDRETASTWDVLGNATAGPLTGKSLTPVEHVDTFWFAWAAFLPTTRLAPSA